MPELQEIEVGDEVLLGSEFGYDVAFLEQGRSLVLRGGFPMKNIAPPCDAPWAFVLQAESDETTRLARSIHAGGIQGRKHDADAEGKQLRGGTVTRLRPLQ